MELRGQQVVVVGGSQGIGLAVAQLAYAQGARVIIMGRSKARLQAAAAATEGMAWVEMDVGDEAAVARAFAPIESINHVYVAAGATRLGSILDEPVAAQVAPLVERVWGSVYVIRAVAHKIAPGGSITLTGGISTDRPVAGAWVSSVGTAAAEQLARIMALDLAPIRFNAVSPGWTDTPMWDRVLGEHKAGVLQGAAERSLVKRIATPEEAAEAVVFLMRNGSVTGEVLHVDGGARLV